MVKLVGGLLLAGMVAGGTIFLMRDDELRASLAHRAVDTLAAWLGVDRESGPADAPRSGKAPGKVGLKKTPPPAPPDPAAKPVAQPVYVDRSPTPSALERVKPEDRKWLDQVIAQGDRPVDGRNGGAKRPAH